jgi:PBP1b-binding outer membrane lipoprotein LpoB
MERWHLTRMDRHLLFVSFVLLGACASTEPPPPVSPAASASAAPAAESPTRALSKSECESLAQWIIDACHERSNFDRSTQAEGWCGETERRATVDDHPWIVDCVKNVKLIDSVCFRSNTRIRSLMDCESSVSR